LKSLLSSSPGYQQLIYEELTDRIAATVTSGEPGAQASGLQFVLEMARDFRHSPHRPWVDEHVGQYESEIRDTAAHDDDFRVFAVSVDVISVEQALTMPGGLSVLLGDRELVARYQAKLTADKETLMRALTAIGRFLAEHEQLPWVSAPLYDEPLPLITMRMSSLLEMFRDRDEFTGLGLAAAIAIGSELSDLPTFKQAYRLSELPMPTRFRLLFKEWAAGRVEFATITNGQSQSMGR
jgi:hypothetical protein